jgi:hypothetical protein
MIEFVDAAIGAAGAGVVAAVAGFIRSRSAKARSDERAQVIAMGDGFGIEYVPGEDFDEFRRDVVRARDRRAAVASKRLHEAEERERDEAARVRRRDEKGRFL